MVKFQYHSYCGETGANCKYVDRQAGNIYCACAFDKRFLEGIIEIFDPPPSESGSVQPGAEHINRWMMLNNSKIDLKGLGAGGV